MLLQQLLIMIMTVRRASLFRPPRIVVVCRRQRRHRGSDSSLSPARSIATRIAIVPTATPTLRFGGVLVAGLFWVSSICAGCGGGCSCSSATLTRISGIGAIIRKVVVAGRCGCGYGTPAAAAGGPAMAIPRNVRIGRRSSSSSRIQRLGISSSTTAATSATATAAAAVGGFCDFLQGAERRLAHVVLSLCTRGPAAAA